MTYRIKPRNDCLIGDFSKISNKRNGFSLMEILIVLTLMTVCIGVIVPTSRTWIRRSEEAHAQSIWEESFRVARIKAMETGVVHLIRFDQSNTTLLVSPLQTAKHAAMVDNLPTKFPCPKKTIINFFSENGTTPLDQVRIDPNGNAECALIEIKRHSSSSMYRIHRFKSHLLSSSKPT